MLRKGEIIRENLRWVGLFTKPTSVLLGVGKMRQKKVLQKNSCFSFLPCWEP